MENFSARRVILLSEISQKEIFDRNLRFIVMMSRPVRETNHHCPWSTLDPQKLKLDRQAPFLVTFISSYVPVTALRMSHTENEGCEPVTC